jgi:hypothetical protein
VSSNCHRLLAEDLVAGTAGVTDLDDRLEVVPLDAPPDSAIAAAAEALIAFTVPGMVSERITASCAGGVLTLGGCIGSYYRRLYAERAVQCVAGVRRVVNDIHGGCVAETAFPPAPRKP